MTKSAPIDYQAKLDECTANTQRLVDKAAEDARRVEECQQNYKQLLNIRLQERSALDQEESTFKLCGKDLSQLKETHKTLRIGAFFIGIATGYYLGKK